MKTPSYGSRAYRSAVYSLSDTLASALLLSVRRAYSESGIHGQVTPKIWIGVFEDPYLVDSLWRSSSLPYASKLPVIGRMYLPVLALLSEHHVVKGFKHYLKMIEYLEDDLNLELIEILEEDILQEVIGLIFKGYTGATIPRIFGVELPHLDDFFALID